MPRLRKPTAAEMAALNALHYEFIGGPVPPSPQPGKQPTGPTDPVHVFLLVAPGRDGKPAALASFSTLKEAIRAADSPRTRKAHPAVTVETVVVHPDADGWDPDTISS